MRDWGRYMTLPSGLVAIIGDPNVAYLLFLIGVFGLITEVYHPGVILPGAIGAVAMVLALLGFTLLPVNWVAVALLALAVGLLLAEAHAPGVGALGLGGVLAFVAGSLLLFTPFSALAATGLSLAVSPLLVVGGLIAVLAFFLIVLRASLRTRRLPVTNGPESLLGKEGIATSDLAPRGAVRLGGEDWSAVAEFAPITRGEPVEVIGLDGVILRVHRPYEWPRAERPAIEPAP